MTRSFTLNDPPNISEMIDGEVMIINLETGSYFSVTGAGASIWPQLIAGIDVASLAAQLCGAFDAAPEIVASDLNGFVDRLIEEEILRPRDNGAMTPSGSVADADDKRREYPGFGFERFDDMRALLVVDPVHEVGRFGWPERATDVKKAR